MNHCISRQSLRLAALLLTSISLPAQTHWQPGMAVPGPTHGSVVCCATWWDPDGAGPATPVLVFGGNFQLPGIGTSNLVMYEPATAIWRPFTESVDGQVQALAVLPTGELVVGGQHLVFGGRAAVGLAVYQNAAFTPLGTPTWAGANVLALLVTPAGDLVVGGVFTPAEGAPGTGLVLWRNGGWQTLAGFSGPTEGLAVRPNGNLIVGGHFNFPGTNQLAHIAEWDGNAWLPLGNGIGGTFQSVKRVAVLANGDVVAAGLFLTVGGQPITRLARWDGANWSAMANHIEGVPKALLPLPNGDLLAGTVGAVDQQPIFGVGRWRQATGWQGFGGGIGEVYALLAMPNGEVLVAGSLHQNQGSFLRCIALGDGQSWRGLGDAFDNTVRGLLSLPGGDMLVTGAFVRAEGVTAGSGTVRGGDSGWQPMFVGDPPPWRGPLTAGFVDAAGELWLAGSVNSMGTGALPAIARWTATGWQPFGSSIPGVACLLVPPGQAPIVGLRRVFANSVGGVLQWNGAAWQTLGAGLDDSVLALQFAANGQLIAGGDFLASGNNPVTRIAAWNGSSWQEMGRGLDNTVRAIALRPNGELIAAGDFTGDGQRNLQRIARWDGNSWQALGAGLTGDPGEQTSVHSLLVLPNGDLLAGGNFRYAGGIPARGVARWDGTAWQAVDGGVDGTVLALAQAADGTVYAGGNFLRAGGRHSAYLARLRSNLPATAVSYGMACAGSAGLPNLEHDSLPWTGSHYQASCRGAAANALAVELFGLLADNSPLQLVHPTAAPSCQLLLQPTSALLRLVQNGMATGGTALPNSPSLAGVQLLQQFLIGELGPTGLQLLASSNALRLTVGAF